uniref:Uncharacterized protein n=1 Tax=Clastoptera arizonana TaxID=38151 RepID=A0A1B6E5T4_9HEMI
MIFYFLLLYFTIGTNGLLIRDDDEDLKRKINDLDKQAIKEYNATYETWIDPFMEPGEKFQILSTLLPTERKKFKVLIRLLDRQLFQFENRAYNLFYDYVQEIIEMIDDLEKHKDEKDKKKLKRLLKIFKSINEVNVELNFKEYLKEFHDNGEQIDILLDNLKPKKKSKETEESKEDTFLKNYVKYT